MLLSLMYTTVSSVITQLSLVLSNTAIFAKMSIMFPAFMDQKKKKQKLSLTFHRRNRIKKCYLHLVSLGNLGLRIYYSIPSFMEHFFVSQQLIRAGEFHKCFHTKIRVL